MKKIVLVAALATFVLASCKKDYTCTCSATVNGQTYSSTSTINATKKDAKSACTAKQSTGYTCTI